MLRLIPTAIHTQADIDYTLKAFEDIAQKLQTGYYAGKMPVLGSVEQ
jgi:glycine C-acetyltransferase